MTSTFPRWILVALIIALPIVAFILGVWAVTEFRLNQLQSAEVIVPTEVVVPSLIVLAVLSVVGLLCLVALLYASKGLEDKKQALGLPEGSVRAVIAFMLLIIFSTSTIYLFQSMNLQHASFEVTTEQLDSVKKSLGQNFVAEMAIFNKEGTVTGYRIQHVPKVSEAASDVAKQLTTTLGTLLTAMAAFYFGTRAATTSEAKKNLPKDPVTVLNEQLVEAKKAFALAEKTLGEMTKLKEKAEKEKEDADSSKDQDRIEAAKKALDEAHAAERKALQDKDSTETKLGNASLLLDAVSNLK